MRLAAITLGALAAISIGGAAKAANVADLENGIQAIQSACEAAQFPAKSQLIECENRGERKVWTIYAPEALGFFDQWAAQRARLTAAVEAKTMTFEAMNAEMESDRAAFNLEVHDLFAEETSERQAQADRQVAAARQQAQSQAVLDAAAAYFQGKAASAAAAPKTQHTDCMWIAQQWSCTTTPY